MRRNKIKEIGEWIGIVAGGALVIGFIVVIVLAAVSHMKTTSKHNGWTAVRTDGIIYKPVAEPWIAIRRGNDSSVWEYMADSNGDSGISGKKTLILCEDSVGGSAAYSLDGKSWDYSTKVVSLKTKITYVDLETGARYGFPVELDAKDLPGSVSSGTKAIRYGNDEVAKAIREQISSGICPGTDTPDQQKQTGRTDLFRIYTLPSGTETISRTDIGEITMLYVPESVKHFETGIEENLWFIVAESGSSAVTWAKENGIPYCEDGSGIITVPESTKPDRLSCISEFRVNHRDFLPQAGIRAMSLPDYMQIAEDGSQLANASIYLIVRSGSAAEEEIIRCNEKLDSDICYLTYGGSQEKDFLSVRPGDQILFGHYEQDGNTQNGKEAVQWDVVTIHGDQALLLSSYVLDAHTYGGDYWTESSLRSWLNTAFAAEAFNADEANAIQKAAQGREKELPSPEGEDLVFLLQSNETKAYCCNIEAPATAVALSGGVMTNSNGKCDNWWSRNSSQNEKKGPGVRPAVWVTLRNAALILENMPVKNEQSQEKRIAAAADTMKKGDSVFFGAMEQDGSTANGPEEIEWIVLNVEKDQALLISAAGLAATRLHPLGDYGCKSSVPWTDSELREWLNTEFMCEAFSPEQQKFILLAKVKNNDGEGFEKIDKTFTDNMKREYTEEDQDYVFLPSWKDVNARYFSQGDDLRVKATRQALYQGAVTDSGYCRYWLRSVAGNGEDYGAINGFGARTTEEAPNSTICIRPMIWLDLEAIRNAAD